MNTKNLSRVLAVGLITALFSNSVFAATWYVDTNADNDPNTCVAGETDDDGDCTLRDAVTQLGIGDTLRFLNAAMTGAMITNTAESTYTVGVDNVTIEGKDENGDDIVVTLAGNAVGQATDGFTVTADGVTIDGLVMVNYDEESGTAAIKVSGDSVTISNNILGLASDGTTISGNDRGVELNGATNATITGNTISGNDEDGIYIVDSSDVTITGNKIGVDEPTGNVDKGNNWNGIVVAGGTINGGDGGTEGVYIGDGTVGGRNIISGNDYQAITVNDAAVTGDIYIDGNYVGVGSDGTTQVANDSNAGTYGIINGDDNVADNLDWSITDNVIAGNDGDAIKILSGQTAVIQGNEIGFDAAGTALENTGDGIEIDATTVTIGSDLDGSNDSTEGNNIGNPSGYGMGIYIYNGSAVADDIATLNIYGNYIGVHSGDASNSYGGFENGIFVQGGTNLTTVNIGGVGVTTATDGRNVVSNNDTNGIDITSTGASSVVTIQNNIIGVNPEDSSVAANGVGISVDMSTGSIATLLIGSNGDASNDSDEGNTSSNNGGNIFVGDGVNAVTIAGNIVKNNTFAAAVIIDGDDLTGVTIGGDATAERNVFGSASLPGVSVTNAGVVPADVTIQNNYIGVDSDGSTAIAIDNGGIEIDAGDTVTVKDNVIGNMTDGSGVVVEGGTSLIMQGNKIGVAANGTTAAGIAGDGVPAYGVSINDPNLTSVIFGTNGDGVNDATEGNVVGAIGDGIGDYGLHFADVAAAAVMTVKGNYFGIGSDGQTTTGLAIGDIAIVAESTGASLTIGGDNELGALGTGALGEGNVIANTTTGDCIKFIDGSVSGYIYGNIFGLKKGVGGVYDTDAGCGNDSIQVDSNSLTTLVIGAEDGDTVTSKRNIISGGGRDGIRVNDTAGVATITIKNNYIGTDYLGVSDLGNAGIGINAIMDGTVTLNVGGTGSNQGNVIGGNGGYGVGLSPTGTLTANLYSNYIGVLSDATTLMANGTYEVYLDSGGGTITNLVFGTNTKKNTVNNTSHMALYLADVTNSNFASGSQLSDLDDINSWTNVSCTATYRYWEQYVGGVLSTFYNNDSCQGYSSSEESAPEPVEEAVEEAAEEVVVVVVETVVEEVVVVVETVVEEKVEEVAVQKEEVKLPEEVEKVLEDATKVFVGTVGDLLTSEVKKDTPKVEETKKPEEKKKEVVKPVTKQEATSAIATYKTELKTESEDPVKPVDVKVSEKAVKAQAVLENAYRMEVLSEEEVSEVNNSAKEVIDESIKEAIEQKGDIEFNLGGGKKVKVEEPEKVEIVAAFGLSDDKKKEIMEEKKKEKKTAVFVDDNTDIDSDGISDGVQMRFGTSLFDEDPDKDGVSLNEELWADTDPLRADSAGVIKPKAVVGSTVLSSAAKKQKVSEVTAGDYPMVRVAGPSGAANVVLLDAETEEEKYSFDVEVEEGKAVVLPQRVEEGSYYVVAKNRDGVGKVSKINVDYSQLIESPEVGYEYALADGLGLRDLTLDEVGNSVVMIAELAGMVSPEFDPEVLLAKSRQTIGILETPRIYGITEPNKIVFVSFESVILSSVVMSDADGEFQVELPDDLPEGDHKVTVFAYDSQRSIAGNIAQLLFRK